MAEQDSSEPDQFGAASASHGAEPSKYPRSSFPPGPYPSGAYPSGAYPPGPYPPSPYQTGGPYQPSGPYAGSPYQPSWQAQQYPVNPALRAATTDRERAIDVLKAAFAEGRLTQAEYNDRMGRAHEARTYGELMTLTGDLPAGPIPLPSLPAWQVPVRARQTNSMAIASMVLGLGEFFTFGLTAIPAVICGHIAQRQMRETGEDGNGMATTGLILGYGAIAFGFIIALLVLTVVARTSPAPPFRG
ncbi:MAG TPA: DUF1707 and DUF4190 domain-containing protein [Streptosporangiaceae bacterium]|nr:DUF1707 and DUF4190 domain-containing protein [Streptosporangiaceae bacterium]